VQADVRAALAELVALHREAVLKTALGYTGSVAEAEDVAQEVFLKALRQLERGAFASGLSRGWFMKATVRTAIDHRRSAYHRRTVSVADVPDSFAADDVTSKGVEAAEAHRAVWQAVRSLPDALREVVLLYYFGELDVRSISRVTGISESNVKVRLHRARERLRSALTDWAE